ncbi:2-hydroxychromene-2-carboxylate isomerase [Phenylobacterium sp.]|uniref:2-hydroxychromene-2-carboxylate isomerase n=1 Tax=Phenylobacterium sp. TaxID=1871053 RepID=UPI0027333611|nr:2-hydroxychromene-2-carboxylate isomerase [Phenylobacterium sp.]MDP3853569.1 2-hydroxychromene-2-carboxylate isomerase [Phenylobacterium sp.]
MNVTFYFDFGSPNAYMSHRVLPAIEARTKARFVYEPILLGGVFKLTGNQSPATAFASIRNKPDYDRIEIARFLKRHGLSNFQFNPHFPINTLQLMRGAVAAQVAGVFEAFVDQVYDDMWTRGRKMDDPEVYAASLVEAGLPKDEILRLSQTEEVKSKLVANTQAAVDAGVFGSPSFMVGQELYFGKDRLREVEDEIVLQTRGVEAA